MGEKNVLQQTVNDLISIAAEADISIAFESDSNQEVKNLQYRLDEKDAVIKSLENQLDILKKVASDENLHKEVIEELNVRIFLLQSKLSSHEAYFDELKVKD